MITKIVKWICIAALCLGAVVWRSPANYQLVLDSVIAAGSVIVAVQAARARQHAWAAGFIVLALLFNPFLTVLRPDPRWNLLVALVCIVPFAISLSAVKVQPLLSVPSITDRNPGSEAL